MLVEDTGKLGDFMIIGRRGKRGMQLCRVEESAVGTVEGTAGFRVYGRGGSCYEKGRLEEVLVRANMLELALKSRIIQNLKNEEKMFQPISGRELVCTRKCILPDYVYYFIITRMCGREQMNSLCRMERKGHD